MARTCPQCSGPVPAPARFCPRCGVRVPNVGRNMVLGMLVAAAVVAVMLVLMLGAVRVERSAAPVKVEAPVTAHAISPAAPAPDIAR
jgi:hypothetical protein